MSKYEPIIVHVENGTVEFEGRVWATDQDHLEDGWWFVQQNECCAFERTPSEDAGGRWCDDPDWHGYFGPYATEAEAQKAAE